MPVVRLLLLVAIVAVPAGCGGPSGPEAGESKSGGEGGTAAAQSSDGFRLADYCTIVLAPKLAADLGLGAVERVQLAVIEDRLIPGLKGCLRTGPTTHMAGSHAAGTPDMAMAERAMLGYLDRSGEKIRDALTPQQIDHFRQLRGGGKVSAIAVRIRPQGSPAAPIYFEVLYTAFGEQSPAKQPISETVHQEDGTTVTETEIHIEESRGDEKILSQIHSVSDAVDVLGAKDAGLRRYGALWLVKIANVEPAERQRVLAALKPLVDEPDDNSKPDVEARARPQGRADHRRKSICVEAFCRWADRDQAAELAQIGHRPLPGENQGSVMAALKTLARLDADAAEKLVQERLGEFFFRSAAIHSLESLTEADGVPPGNATRLLAILQNHRSGKSEPLAREGAGPARSVPRAPKSSPKNEAGSKSEASAGTASEQIVADLQSGDRSRQIRVLMQLQHNGPAQPDPAVAKALEAIVLEGANTALRASALGALRNWGVAESLPTLQKAAKDPNRTIQVKAKDAISAITSRQ